MISLDERKLALFIQTNLIRRELDNLRRQDYTKPQLQTSTGRKVYTGFIELVASLDFNSKEK